MSPGATWLKSLVLVAVAYMAMGTPQKIFLRTKSLVSEQHGHSSRPHSNPEALIACLQAIQDNDTSSSSSYLTTPSSPLYASERLVYNLNLDFHPIAIFHPASEPEAAAAIRCAATRSIPVAPRCGGHSFEGYSVGGRDGALVIDLDRFQHFDMDPVTAIATVGAGFRLGPLYTRLWQAGEYLISGGICPSVGVAGLALGGGLGQLHRRYGLLSQNVVGLTMLDASGHVRHICPTSDPDLFWALRGAGGGSFGLVTQFQIQAYEAPPHMTLFTAVFPVNASLAIVEAFGEWCQTAPDHLAPGIHIDAKGLHLKASAIGWEDEGALDSIKELIRSVGVAPLQPPRMVQGTWFQVLSERVKETGGGNVSEPDLGGHRNYRGRSLMYRQPMSRAALEVLVEHVLHPPEGSTHCYVNMEVWGGKIDQPQWPSAMDHHLGALYSIQYGVGWDETNGQPGVVCQACMDWSASLAKGLQATYGTDKLEAYQNYIEQDIPNGLEAYYGDQLSRLIDIKRHVDPQNVFTFPQAIPLHP